MKKKILALALTLILMLSLTACGKTGNIITPDGSEITAESLLNNGIPDDKSLDATIAMGMDAIVKLEPSGDDAGQITDNINISVNMTGIMQRDGELSHSTGSMSITVLDAEFAQEFDQWTNGATTYDYNAETDTWSSGTNAANDTVTSAMTFASDAFKNLKLENKPDEYIVTGEINTSNELTNDLTASIEELLGTSLTDSVTMTAEMHYDKMTTYLKSMKYSINAPTHDTSTAVLNKFSIELTVNSIGEISLELPAELAS